MKHHQTVHLTKKTALGLVAVFLVILISAYLYRCNTTEVCGIPFVERLVRKEFTIKLPEGVVYAEVAETREAREQGLSFRKHIGTDRGMLFVFGISGRYGFWMKDMLMPIDMIWINDKGVVVKIVENAKPEDYPATYINDAPASYVLELASGQAKAKGLYLGTKVSIQTNN